jgi:hypothetical protein
MTSETAEFYNGTGTCTIAEHSALADKLAEAKRGAEAWMLKACALREALERIAAGDYGPDHKWQGPAAIALEALRVKHE